MRTRLFLLALFCFATTLLWGQAALAPGVAKGTFVAGGKTVQMRHVYALIKPDTFDETKDTLFLFFTDVPVTDEMLQEEFGLSQSFRDGKLTAIEMRLDENKSPRGGQLYHSGLEDPLSVSGIGKLDLKYFDGKRITGRLYSGPEESFGKSWEFNIDFSANIQPKPAPVPEKLLPLDSPPARLALAFVKAARAGDKAGLKKLITPDMAADLDGPQGAEIMKFLKEAYPLTMKLTKVVQKGDDKAEIVFAENSKDSSVTTTMKAALIDGGWILTK